ncbi:MAG: hypothetical protein KKH01_07435 [Firmicutes bacterium]|nr:hypothetical protein [Bacillota bacterium]
MKEATRFLGFFSILMTILLIYVTVDFFIDINLVDVPWGVLLSFYYLVTIIAVMAIILTVPFLIYLKKVKFRNMKFYTFSHLTFVILTIILLIVLSI